MDWEAIGVALALLGYIINFHCLTDLYPWSDESRMLFTSSCTVVGMLLYVGGIYLYLFELFGNSIITGVVAILIATSIQWPTTFCVKSYKSINESRATIARFCLSVGMLFYLGGVYLTLFELFGKVIDSTVVHWIVTGVVGTPLAIFIQRTTTSSLVKYKRKEQIYDAKKMDKEMKQMSKELKKWQGLQGNELPDFGDQQSNGKQARKLGK